MDQYYPDLYRPALLEAGLMDKCASIREFDASLDVEHLLGGREEEAYPLMVEACLQCIEDGADVICLGSTTMHAAGPHLAETLPVPVINPGPLTYKLAELVLGLGLTHSRVAYRKPQAPNQVRRMHLLSIPAGRSWTNLGNIAKDYTWEAMKITSLNDASI